MTNLGADSGYGGSIAGESGGMHDWQAGLMEDKPTPARTPGSSEMHPAGMLSTLPCCGWEMANGLLQRTTSGRLLRAMSINYYSMLSI